jgi:hypothetical protein
MIRAARIGALLLLWLIPTTIFSKALTGDWLATWHAFHLPSMLPRFLDMNAIASGVEVLHQGGDPLVANPADPIHRPLNYPRIWLYLFSALGVNRGNAAIVALIFCGLYLTCMSILILQAERRLNILILLVASLSAAPLLAMERGNTDLFIFSLVFLGCLATNRTLKSWIFAAATLLKIYPIAAMAVDTIRRPTKQITLPFVLMILVVFTFVLQWHDVMLIRHNTPISGPRAYGALALEGLILPERLRRGLLLMGVGWAVLLLCWGAGARAVVTAWKKLPCLEESIRNSQQAEMFSVFGGMYAFTYAIGSNYDYRLILLLPTIPLVLEMARDPLHRKWGIAYLTLLVAAENVFVFIRGLDHLATFSLFIMVLAILTVQFRDLVSERATSDLPIGKGNEA